MATVQYGTDNGDRNEQVTEATGGAAPTKTVEVNIKTGQRKELVLLALERIKNRIATSSVFEP